MVKTILRALMTLTVIGAFSYNTSSAAGTSPTKPDFAFPDKVAAEASLQLQQALTNGDSRQVVKSLIDYSLARNAVSPDFLPEVLQRIDSVKLIEKDPCVSSLLAYLQAKIYQGMYSRNRWKYDHREIPLDSLASDPTAWSGLQYKHHIFSLINEATGDPSALLASPLNDWKDIIVANEYSYILYPTLYDLIAYNAIDILRDLDTTSPILPARYLNTPLLTQQLPRYAAVSEYSRRAHEISLSLLQAHRDNLPAYVTAYLNNIDCTSWNVNLSDDSLHDAFMKAFDTFKDCEWGIDALLEAGLNDSPAYLDACTSALAKYPNYYRVNELRNYIERLTRVTASYNFPARVSPSVPFDIKVRLSNTSSATVYIYRDARSMDSDFEPLNAGSVIADKSTRRYEVSIPEQPLPYSGDTSVKVTVDKPGRYVIYIKPQGGNREAKDLVQQYTTCVDFAPFTVNFDNKTYPYAVRGTDGAPMQGVDVAYSKDYRSNFINAGSTDSNGTLSSPLDNVSRLKFTLDNQVVNENYTYSSKVNPHTVWYLHATLFTDLPLYHPGDSLQWVVTTYLSTGYDAKVAPGSTVNIKFENANHETFDSATVTTDASGRSTGAIRLPEGGLSGMYFIRVEQDNKFISSTRYMVNDYKLPTFEATVTDLRRNAVNPDSTITLTCNAKAYSGFPIADAHVSVTLADAPSMWWWHSTTQPAFWSTQLSTDPQGNATLVIPRYILEMSPSCSSAFKVNIDITSSAGETRSCTRVFSLEKPYIISFSNPGNIDIDKPLTLGAQAFDANGTQYKIAPTYTFVLNDKVIATGVTNSLPHSIKPGIYDIIASLPDTTLATPVTVTGVNLYSLNGDCPVESALYLPITTFTAQDEVYIPLGTFYDNTNILVTKTVDNNMVSRNWYTPRRGMSEYAVSIEPDCEQVTLTFTTIHNHTQYISTATVTNSLKLANLNIEVSSFRDKVIPDTPEEIKLHVTLNNQPTEASVILVMQSRALLSLSPYSLKFPSLYYRYYTPNLSSFYNSASGYYASTFKSFDTATAIKPSLQLYGMRFGNGISNLNGIKIRGASRLNSSKQAVMTDEVVMESEESMVMYAAAPMSKAMAAGTGTNDVFAMVTESAADEAAPDNGSSEEETAPDNFSYRPSEIPLAFFAPKLSTDSLGSLTYTYHVPSANTSWVLNALAFTRSMASTSVQRSVTASRPVMAQLTAPRFLRYGDHVVLRGTVMNAIDSLMQLHTTISVLDPLTMKEIASSTTVTDVTAFSSTLVSLPFEAPHEGSALIYRIKTSNGQYTDGEQCLIRLMPASQPVTTSKSFYIDADSTSFSTAIEATGHDINYTLYMYENPLWEIMTALPSLHTGLPTTSSQAVDNIYMASIARGILQKHPNLKQALTEWLTGNQSDSTLVSMLQRNEELKQIVINATPWAREAQSDTERLTSIALILDDNNLSKTIDGGVKTLQSLTKPDGGISWCPGASNSSSWATMTMLYRLASLQQRGYMPSNKLLATLLTNAVKYIDDITARQLSRDKGQGDYTEYVFVRSFIKAQYPSPTLTKATRLTINNILKRWEREPVTAKATDAVILYYNNYPSMARRVIASINAYSLKDATRGCWWYGLDVNATARLLHAIETITPTDKTTIKSVAQWLILAKTRQSWGSSSATSATVDALLGALDVPQAVNGSVAVSIENAQGSHILGSSQQQASDILHNDTPKLPGMLVANLSDILYNGNAILSVSKDTSLPAMGAVISTSTMALDSIPASSHPSVAISKRYNVAKGTYTVGADTLSIGDRLKTQLVITVTDDLDYVTVIDRRAACLEPVQQLSRYVAADGTFYYMEVTDSETRYYFDSLRHGTYVIDNDMNVMATGEFASGVASLQSQINPSIVANSSSKKLLVK